MIGKTEDGRELIDGIDVTGWSEADKTALYAAISAEKSEKEAAAKAEAETTAYHRSPAVVIAKRKAEAEEAKAARETAERRLEEDKKFDELQVQYGRSKVRRINTKRGMVVIRMPKDAEIQDHFWRQKELNTQAEKWQKQMGYYAGLCVYPEQAKVREIAAEFPGLWDELALAVNDMTDAVDRTVRPTG